MCFLSVRWIRLICVSGIDHGGSCQMRQNGCHPHRPASTLSIDQGGLLVYRLLRHLLNHLLIHLLIHLLNRHHYQMILYSDCYLRRYLRHSPALIMVAASRWAKRLPSSSLYIGIRFCPAGWIRAYMGGSCQMRQNGCHPHRPASTLSIDLGDWIRLYMGGIPDEVKTAFLWLSYGFSG